jgi:hypothetical protein
LGELAAEAAVPEIHRALSWRSRLTKRFSRRGYPRRTDGFFDGA